MYKKEVSKSLVKEHVADIVFGVVIFLVFSISLHLYLEETCPPLRLGVLPPEEMREYLTDRGFVCTKVVTPPVTYKDRPAEVLVETASGRQIRAHIEKADIAQRLVPGHVLYVHPMTKIAWKYYHR